MVRPSVWGNHTIRAVSASCWKFESESGVSDDTNRVFVRNMRVFCAHVSGREISRNALAFGSNVGGLSEPDASAFRLIWLRPKATL